MDTFSLPENMRQLVDGELSGTERVRWVGQPVPRKAFPWMAWFPVLFSIPWTLFSLFWITAAAGLFDPVHGFQGAGQFEKGRIVFAMFGIPFVLIGIAMMSSPYWIARRIHRAIASTVYVITDRRAIIFDGGFYGENGLAMMIVGTAALAQKGISISSYTPDKLGNIQRIQREDGSGDVIFGDVLRSSTSDMSSFNGVQPRPWIRAGFFSIHEVKHVEDLLRSLVETPGNPG